jgi:hypothetical protein
MLQALGCRCTTAGGDEVSWGAGDLINWLRLIAPVSIRD